MVSPLLAAVHVTARWCQMVPSRSTTRAVSLWLNAAAQLTSCGSCVNATVSATPGHHKRCVVLLTPRPPECMLDS